MPRYVILRHECPPGYSRPSHWDFMLEVGQTLKTWALPHLPFDTAPDETTPDATTPGGASGNGSCRAEALADHRLEYLTYEGPVSGGRGDVARWDQGAYRLVGCSEDEWIVELRGERLQGCIVLRRIAAEPQFWRWQFRNSIEGRP
jgi:hypothetical protein